MNLNYLLPICVDLDNTFILTDVFEEGLLKLLKVKPFRFIEALFVIMFYGVAQAKRYVAIHANLDLKILPVNQELLDVLRYEKNNGRKIFLVTAANNIIAEKIVNLYDVFDGFFASDLNFNLKGRNKAQLLVEKFGDKNFIYVGDSNADLWIWSRAVESWVVYRSKIFLKKVTKKCNVSKSFFVNSFNFKLIIKQIRLVQWVKNILVFVPIFLSHNIFDIFLLVKSVVAFFALSLCSSSVYVLNDLFDLEADRTHPEKKLRPIASGLLSIKFGILLFVILFSLSIILAFSPLIVGAYNWLLYYFILTQLYSLKLKTIPILDVIILGVLFTLRIIYGGYVTYTPPSSWLMSLSLFFFVNLGLLKRATEVSLLKCVSIKKTTRGYMKEDLDIIITLGISSAMISVLIYVLYISSEKVRVLYIKPDLLWLVSPLLIYWLGRMWLMVKRGQMLYDPVMFTIKDKTSYVVFFLCVFIIIIATIGG